MDTLKSIMAGFIENHNFSYFGYKRYFANQSFCVTTNEKVSFEPFVRRAIPQVLKDGSKILQSFDFLCDECLEKDEVEMIQDMYGLYHTLITIRRYRTHYDVFSLSMGKSNSFSSSFYLSHLQEIHEFQDLLTKRMNVLSKNTETQDIASPKRVSDPLFNALVLDLRHKYDLYDATGNVTYVTALEYFCVSLFSYGKCYKEIASMFHVSPRTVETYLTRAKQRAGYTTPQEILKAVRFFDAASPHKMFIM